MNKDYFIKNIKLWNWIAYKDNHPDLNKKSEDFIIKHVLKHGINEGRNITMDGKNRISKKTITKNFNLFLPEDFNWHIYISLYNDLKHMNEIDAKIHYILYGNYEGRSYIENIVHPLITKSKFLNEIDKIYVINLKKKIYRKHLIHQQCNLFDLNNVLIIDAVNSYNKEYDKMYNDIIKNKDENWIKHNFPRGALGCLLSHKKCIENAINNNYKSILILEDDALLKFDSNNIDDLIYNKKIPENWDFIYLGKKEGYNVKKYNPHSLTNNYINNEIYIPGESTWASHAWLIKNNMFKDLNKIYSIDIDNPVDIIIKKLYNRYNFYCLKDDLFISKLDDSDIRTCNNESSNFWNWNVNNYFCSDINVIKNIYIWGFTHSNTDNSHTHSYIHESIYNSFKKCFPYLNVVWVKNEYDSTVDYNNSLFFVSPTHGDYDQLPLCNSYYIFHIDNFDDNLGLNINTFKKTKYYKLIENKKAIILECRLYDKNNYNDFFIEDSKIILNWGVDYDFNLISDILLDKINYYDKIKNNKYFAYHGSVWYLNVDTIIDLSNSCEKNKIPLLVSGRNRYIWGDNNKFKDNKYTTTEDFWKLKKPNTIERLNNDYGLKTIFAIQGKEHIGSYISDRVYKYPLNGYIAFTNNYLVKQEFPSVIYSDNIENIILEANVIVNDEKLYNDILKKQIIDIISKNSTIIKIYKMIHFLSEVNSLVGETFNFENIHYLPKTIRFTNNINQQKYFNIDDNETLNKLNNNLLTYDNYSIDFDFKVYDFGVIYSIINRIDFTVEIDKNYDSKDFIYNSIFNKKKIIFI